MAALDLAKTSNILNSTIDQRNKLLEEMRTNQGKDQENFNVAYFALPNPLGQIDARYKDIIGAVYSYNDDCIFYTQQLYDDLAKYGRKHRRKRFRFLASADPLPAADWTRALADDLIPSNDSYAGWLSGFREPPARFYWLTKLFCGEKKQL
ncbi:hypothetical protein [Labrys sp. 22185]|uniref:hypothetical protein n=1 Tax=Labrys sp. 22185 TaxID=3453888 RepID=UPI003F82E5C4